MRFPFPRRFCNGWRVNSPRLLAHALILAAFAACSTALLSAAQLEVMEVSSAKLKGNPLGDPVARRVAVLVPDGTTRDMGLPLVIYLPGWGGSSEDIIARRGGWLAFAVDRLARAGVPVRIAVVDGRSHYGGSQYLNSGATGIRGLRRGGNRAGRRSARYPLAKGAAFPRIIAGHSSGGYGALMLAM